MTAKDHKITFPYGATSKPYSKTNPHRGNDRSMPVGTPVVVAGKTIGLSGNSGASTGPHLHTQAGSDIACQNTLDPTPYEFKPGKVVAIRKIDTGAWGLYVTIQVSPRRYITYAHLSRVDVNVNDVIKEEPMKTNREEAIWLYRVTMGIHSPTEAQKKGWTGRDLTELLQAIKKDKRHINYVKGDPTSNDAEVKQSLKDKIVNLVRGA